MERAVKQIGGNCLQWPSRKVSAPSAKGIANASNNRAVSVLFNVINGLCGAGQSFWLLFVRNPDIGASHHAGANSDPQYE
jgi:hypothetical protein